MPRKQRSDPPSGEALPGGGNGKRFPWKPIALAVALAGLFLASRFLPAERWAKAAEAWVDSLGAWGPVAFIALYIGATIGMLPGSPLTVAAGALFGAWGILYVLIGATIGACWAFLLGRHAARDAIAGYMAGSETFRRADDLIAKRGVLVVAILRLLPIFPFNLLNYALGLTRIGFWPYALATAVFIAPGTAMYVLGADALKRALVGGEGFPWGAAGLAALLVAAVTGLGFWAKRKLAALEREDAGDKPRSGDGA